MCQQPYPSARMNPIGGLMAVRLHSQPYIHSANCLVYVDNGGAGSGGSPRQVKSPPAGVPR